MIKPANNLLLILGMHRSGTSCLAGCLEQAGVYLGSVNQSAEFNLKGNRENQNIVKLHNDILARGQASWDMPPLEDMPLCPDDVARLTSIINAYPARPLIGFKDPRSLFCLPLWHKAARPQFIGSFRHPLETAHSLLRRAKAQNKYMSLAKALSLWRVYNGRMLAAYAVSPFPIIRYDVAPDVYMANLRCILPQLGLKPDAPIDFRDDALKTQVQSVPVPDELSFMWDVLTALAVSAEAC